MQYFEYTLMYNLVPEPGKHKEFACKPFSFLWISAKFYELHYISCISWKWEVCAGALSQGAILVCVLVEYMPNSEIQEIWRKLCRFKEFQRKFNTWTYNCYQNQRITKNSHANHRMSFEFHWVSLNFFIFPAFLENGRFAQARLPFLGIRNASRRRRQVSQKRICISFE